MKGDDEIVRFLVDRGIVINVKDNVSKLKTLEDISTCCAIIYSCLCDVLSLCDAIDWSDGD